MTSTFFALLFLYFSIVATILLSRANKVQFLGNIAVASCMLLFDLPDIDEYKEHFRLASQDGLSHIILPFNFEPGYNLLVSLLSKLVTFEIFYVIVVALAIQAYTKVFKKLANRSHYIYLALFLSTCLYFVAFTIRATIASIFLAYAILLLKEGKNLAAGLLILFGGLFHVMELAMIILPLLNTFSDFVSKRYISIFFIAVGGGLLIGSYVPLELFLGTNEMLDLKLAAYASVNIASSNIYFTLWILSLLCSLASFKYLPKFDRVLVVSTAFIIFLSYPFGFIQGRFMWLISFVFIYIFTKGTLARIDLGKIGGIILTITLPLVVFLRY